MRAVDAHEAQRGHEGHEGRAVVAHEHAQAEPERGGGHEVTVRSISAPAGIAPRSVVVPRVPPLSR